MSKDVQHNICILGGPGSGKTCFLAGLALLSESTQKNTFQLKGKSGSKTHVWLTELSRTIRALEWPAATTGTKLFELDFVTKGRVIPMKMIDYAGDSLYETGGDLDQEITVDIGNFLNSCNTIILLLDPTVDVIESAFADPDDLNYSTERVSSLLSAVLGPSLNDTLAKMDVALVISKADTVAGDLDSESAKRMIKSTLPGFYEKITAYCKNTRLGFFFISSVGATQPGIDGYDQPGSELNPQGYEALFDWIISGRDEKKRAKLIRPWSIAFFLCVLAAAVGWYLYGLKTDLIVNPTSSLAEKIQTYNWLPYKTQTIERAMDEIVERNLTNFRNDMESAKTEAQLEDIRSKMAILRELKNTIYEHEIQNLDNKIISKQEEILVDKIKFYIDNNNLEEATINIGQYKEKYPRGILITKVNEMELILTNKHKESLLRQINDVTTTRRSKSSWPAFLEDKAKAIETYLNDSQISISDAKRSEIKKAVELARYFSKNSEFSLTVLGANGLAEPYDTYLKIQINGKSPTTIQTDSQDSKNPSWNKNERIRWSPGDQVTIEWYYDGYLGDDIMAQENTEAFWSIEKLFGTVSLITQSDGRKKMGQTPQIKFDLIGSQSGGSKRFEPNDWTLLKNYIHPGDAWSDEE
jgi:hypothetical protein